MKRVFIFCFLILLVSSVYALSADDENAIQSQIQFIVDSVNTGNISAISSIISPNADTMLMNYVENTLQGRVNSIVQRIDDYEEIDNVVNVYGNYDIVSYIPGDNQVQLNYYSNSDFSNYYVFERVNDSWLLLESDFYQFGQKTDDAAITSIAIIGVFFIILFLFLFLISILFTAFWIWMIVDCAKREFENKIVWLLVIILLGALGAILYFFIVRSDLKKNEKSK